MWRLWVDMIWLCVTGPQGRWWIYIWVFGISLIFLSCPLIRWDAMKKYHGRHISMHCQNIRANYLGSSDGMSRAGGIGLVLQNSKFKLMYILSFFQNNWYVLHFRIKLEDKQLIQRPFIESLYSPFLMISLCGFVVFRVMQSRMKICYSRNL